MRTKSPEILNAVYDYIESYYAKYECSPSLVNVAEKIGKAKSTAHEYIRELVHKGRLEQTARGFKPISAKFAPATEIPKVGYISCGTPFSEEENIENYVQIPNWFFKTKQKYFVLQASGDSMIGVGINDGDLVIVRQQETAEEGNVIVALTEDGESTLKTLKFDRINGKVILHPENIKYPDIYLDCVKIQGVVEKVIKDFD